MLALAAASYAFSFGLLVEINCLFDRTNPEIFHTKVVQKFKNSGENSIGYLHLAAFGPVKTETFYPVSDDFYKNVSEGQLLEIAVFPGWLRMPWHKFGLPWDK
jgi:hypothetical protein